MHLINTGTLEEQRAYFYVRLVQGHPAFHRFLDLIEECDGLEVRKAFANMIIDEILRTRKIITEPWPSLPRYERKLTETEYQLWEVICLPRNVNRLKPRFYVVDPFQFWRAVWRNLRATSLQTWVSGNYWRSYEDEEQATASAA